MLIRENKGFCSFPFDSAHVKNGVWTWPYSSYFVIWGFCVTREELELFADFLDFTTQIVYVVLRRGSSEWFAPSIESDLDMWFSIYTWTLELAYHDFYFFKINTFSGVRTEYYFQKEYHICLSLWFWKTTFYIRDPWSSIFSVREPCHKPLKRFEN